MADTQQLTVTVTLANGDTADVTADSTYESSAPAVATVDADGLIHAAADGDADITASYMGLTSSPCAVNVSNGATMLAVAPPTAALNPPA